MKKQITIRLLPTGKIEAKTSGIYGKKCLDYIILLEKMLEARTDAASYTEDYYKVELSDEVELLESDTVSLKRRE